MKTRQVLGLCVAALIAIVGGCAYLMTGTARTAMTRQVISRETSVAVERAAQIAEAVTLAHDRLLAAAALPGGVAAVERGDAAFIQAALDRSAGGAVKRAAVTVGDRVLARTPHDRPAVVVDDDSTHVQLIGTRDAGVTFSAPMRSNDGSIIARLHEEVSLAALVPRLTQPLFGGHDVVTLVDRSGSILVAPSPRAESKLTSPEVLRLVAGGETRGVRYSSDERGGRIASAAAVPGHDWAVLVDADASEANAPAGSLVARMLFGFLALAVLAGAVLGVTAAVILVGRRRLQHAHERSMRDATTDPLTGAGNRRAFEARLVLLRESDAPVGVVIVDIDRLKGINDAHGHAMGDVVIRRVSDAIHAAVRSNDAVFRIGGDEFAVIAADLSATAARELAIRIGERVAAEDFEGAHPLRASVGSAGGAGSSVDDLLHQADSAMYAAKHAPGIEAPSR